jgi:hypothetical protein
MPGGGGTDMGVGIQAASTLKPIPRILIILTDGFTPWPKIVSQKFEKVIVCLTTHHAKNDVPDWAEVIMIEDKG